MNLILVTRDTQPEDFILIAQNMDNFDELIGYSATGTEYTGDFSGFHARFGRTNDLGKWTYDPDLGIDPVYTPPSRATIDENFNAWQDSLREQAYRLTADRLLAEAWRHEIDPSSNGTKRGTIKQKALNAVNAVKARFPKV